jgi:2-polyprenyl-3-methyl-5-hydroxy-6-metoxy-1,4-benzoquinol methylase/GT2 family glycosyltransferase
MTTDERYDFAYDQSGVYGRAVRLIRQYAGTGVHLDLGCGHGAIAEQVREHGLTYLGMDLASGGLQSLSARGFETAVIDLQDVEAALGAVDRALAGRRLASISLLDTIEHITTAPALLAALVDRAVASEASLIVSVPNVAHQDVAVKLLLGRFDYTTTGLLDDTHVVMYTARHLEALMASAGWHEIAAADLPLVESDQHFPSDHVALARASVLHRFLVGVRASADPHGQTNQFVRAYRAGGRVPTSTVEPDDDTPRPFLTVVLRTQGRRRQTLRDALLCLMAQTVADFDVVIVGHRVRPDDRGALTAALDELPESLRQRTRLVLEDDGSRARPLNVGMRHARGRYVAFLDDDDLVFGHWVEAFAEAASAAPGQVVRSVCVEQDIDPLDPTDQGRGAQTAGPLVACYPREFDLIAHMSRNHTPFMSYAFPSSLFRDLGLQFDESLDICEDWDFELRAALTVGVASWPEVTAIYRRWSSGPASDRQHDEEQWRRTEGAILAKIDQDAHLFPPGTIAALREATDTGMGQVGREFAALKARNDELEEHALRMERSRSWRLTAPLRALTNRRRRPEES